MGTSHKNGHPYGKRVEALSQVIAAQPDLQEEEGGLETVFTHMANDIISYAYNETPIKTLDPDAQYTFLFSAHTAMPGV